MSRAKLVTAVAITATAVVCLIVALWRTSAGSPPVVSIGLLGYTNRVGPYAFLAITNCSESTITLDSQCLVKYGQTPEGGALRRDTVIEPNTLRVTRLRPHEGFVQEVFVFPATGSQWELECYAAYRSAWYEVRRSAERWFHKRIRRVEFPPRSKTWHTFDSELFICPP